MQEYLVPAVPVLCNIAGSGCLENSDFVVSCQEEQGEK